MGAYTEPLHVVVCDDDEIDAELLIERLSEGGVGHSWHHCLGGPALLQYIREEASPRPCLILLDLRMPGVGGLEVLEQLRADPALRDLMVYVYTHSGEPSDVNLAHQTGVQGYIKKPSTPAELDEMTTTLHALLDLLILPYPPRNA